MKLYHVTTPKKLEKYEISGRIIQPVRGFRNQRAAEFWAKRTLRSVILEVEADRPHKLPDHHNKYGEAWWNDGDIVSWKRVGEQR